MSEQNKKNSNNIFTVDKEQNLLDFLFTIVPKSKAKIHLKKKRIFVNNQLSSQYNYALKANDKVEIRFAPKVNTEEEFDFRIIYEDKDLIVIDKPAGILSVASKKEYDHTALSLVNEYLSNKEPYEKAYAVHRLERDMSGLMIMAKSHETKAFMQDNWNDLLEERFFMAIVEGKPEPWSGTISSYLKENKAHTVYVCPHPSEGTLATCHYKLFKSKRNFSLLKLRSEKGYKHQLRVQLSSIEFPIVGDAKYGSKIDPINRIALHSFSLKIKHPYKNKMLDLKCDLPKKFLKLI